MSATGICEGTWQVPVARSIAEAVRDAEVIIVAVPANGHARIIDAMVPHLADGQTVIVSAELSLSGALLIKEARARGLQISVISWATTAVTAHSTGLDGVFVSLLRKKLDIAAMPTRSSVAGQAMCSELFGISFEIKPNPLAIALSNINAAGHMAVALCNFTRMERGEDWSSYGGITPGVGELIERLDEERLALATSYGLEVRSVVDHYVHSFPVERGSIDNMAQAIALTRPHVKGPTSTDTRYVTEDVPFGLQAMVELAAITGVAMPLHQSGIELFSALYGTEFRSQNDILPRLIRKEETAEGLQELLR
ncbi:NAD/NADP octopine/nopaline dehydrogenase family protein [Shinella sp. S4-D37]|uniref:NAD/NADP octopine/nopaline dehydrogenase family protein n=1 Tax=Shinella sp. S4-D37 TaxID=3161999 RepID=UPI00346556EF